MVNGRIKMVLGLGVLLIALLLLAWAALPRVLPQLPGRVRQYLPEGIAVATPPPLPTPVPAAVVPVVETELLAVPTPAPSATATSPASAETAVAPAATNVPLSPTTEAIAAPPRVYLTGVDIIPQKFNNCGPTNLAMVLGYFGREDDQFDIAAVVRPTYEDRNVSPDELAAYVTARTDLEAAVFTGGDRQMLKQLLATGLPVIVEKGLVPDEETGWMGHYLTLYGYDDAAGEFYTRDSFLGPWDEDGTEAYDQLAENWRMFNNTFVVVYPPEQRGTVAGIIGPALDDPALMWAQAAEAARAAIRENPTDPFAWFNLGTALTRSQAISAGTDQLVQAVASFDRARQLGLPPRMLWYQFAPYEAYLANGRLADVVALAEATLSTQGGRNVEETYLYRALAQRQMGDEQGAARDLRTAAALNPHNPLLLRVEATP